MEAARGSALDNLSAADCGASMLLEAAEEQVVKNSAGVQVNLDRTACEEGTYIVDSGRDELVQFGQLYQLVGKSDIGFGLSTIYEEKFEECVDDTVDFEASFLKAEAVQKDVIGNKGILVLSL